MKLNNLKRKVFFWIDKLQITRKERVSFSLLLLILCLMFLSSFFIKQKLNYQQEDYNEILTLFEERSKLAEQKQAAIAEKYNPDFTVNNADNADTEPNITRSQDPVTSVSEADNASVNNTVMAPVIININTAGSEELQTLDGIGPAYAGRIIEYREANGEFKTIEELINIKGIGEKRLEAIRPYITLEP
jgi:comEA protein